MRTMHSSQEERDRLSFHEAETICEYRFRQFGRCWHLFTPENYEIIFADDDDFRAGMTLFALCVLSFPNIRILTFEWMNNHLHVTLAGDEADIRSFFRMLSGMLEKYFRNKGRTVSLKSWNYELRAVNDLKDLRSVIAYNNRNGFLVDEGETPFSYPWGANRFFFNPSACKEHDASTDRLRVRFIWKEFHTRAFDRFSGLVMIDGYVSPLAYCCIHEAESLFRSAHQYFHAVSRDLDAQRRITKEFGGRITYTDNEMYSVVSELCRTTYSVGAPTLLPKEAKVEVARKMHFEYNASNKQIARILRIEYGLIPTILGER
jgi:hypothetical protein